MDIDRCWVFYSESGSLGITTGCKRFARKDCLAVWRWRAPWRSTFEGLELWYCTYYDPHWHKRFLTSRLFLQITRHCRVLRPTYVHLRRPYKGSGRQERLYYVTIKTASFKKAWSGRSSHWMINSDTWLRKQTRTWPPFTLTCCWVVKMRLGKRKREFETQASRLECPLERCCAFYPSPGTF